MFLTSAAMLLGTGWAQAATVRAAGSWGRAIEVPGLGALNKGLEAEVSSVSCASPGYCAGGGYYGTAVVIRVSSPPDRGSWSARATAAGERRSRCPASVPSTRD